MRFAFAMFNPAEVVTGGVPSETCITRLNFWPGPGFTLRLRKAVEPNYRGLAAGQMSR